MKQFATDSTKSKLVLHWPVYDAKNITRAICRRSHASQTWQSHRPKTWPCKEMNWKDSEETQDIRPQAKQRCSIRW